MTMPAGTSSAEDPELAKRTATANELATECDRLRTTRDLLTTHLSRLSPPGLENANGGLNTSFNTDTHDNASTVFDEEMSETASMFSHATAQTAVTSASRGGSRFGGKSLGGASRKSRRSRKKNAKNNATGGDALAKLSPREKRVLANTELEYLEKALANDQMEGGKRVDSLRAKVEETELRLAATSKAFFEFSREVLGHAGGGGGGSGNSFQSTSSGGGRLNTHARTRDDGGHVRTTKNTRPGGSSVVSAEKWQRHLDSLIASKKANAGQFRLKTASAKVQVKQLEQSLRQKERAGEHLTAVDHATLLIERNRRFESLELRNAELRRLATVASNAQDQLAKCKLDLTEKSRDGQFLKADTAAKRVMILSFDVLMIQVKADHARVRKSNKDLHVAGSSGDNPPVGEYARVKTEAQLLAQKVKDAERKLELARAKCAKRTGTGSARVARGGDGYVKGTVRLTGRV